MKKSALKCLGFGIPAVVLMVAGSAVAADAPLLGAHNNHAPIEVTSDALTVYQQQNEAVFTGHVVAVQEGARLKADRMTVHYKNTGNAGAPAKTNATPPQGAIQEIDAEGNVFLATAGETASGTKGIYDVVHHQIHLDGDVVLTRDKNVLKGGHLVYNFDTGKSVLTGGVTSAPGEKQRVRALFVPAQDKDKSGK